jgi:hypothetical protein
MARMWNVVRVRRSAAEGQPRVLYFIFARVIVPNTPGKNVRKLQLNGAP